MTQAFNAAVLRMLERPFAVTAGAWLLRAARAIGGASLESRLLHLIDVHGIRSGWPGHPQGWVNLHVSRWARLSRRRAAGIVTTPRSARAKGDGPWRVGILGGFAGLLSFPRDLFTAVPADIDVHIFDLDYHGRRGRFLEPLVRSYVAVPSGNGQATAAAAAITAADLDLLLLLGPRGDAYDVLDHVEARAIAIYCTGSDLMYHERLDYQMHGQPQADYFLRDRRMFCGITRRPVSADVVLPIEIGYYDRRGLDLSGAPPWRRREPLIVFHGSLYKAAQPAMLEGLLSLLAEDSALQFVLMGRDDGRSLREIEAAASARGVGGRVHYEGAFNSIRDDDAGVADAGWQRLIDLLSRARLAPDPFPVGGGSSRFEAYALGAPGVHLGVRFDEAAWGQRQDAACDVLFLNTTRGTAYSVDDYFRRCRQCLSDETFADQLADEQRAVAVTLVDSHAWWERLRRGYDEWRTH